VVLFYNSDSPYSQKLRDSFAKAIKEPGGKIVKEIDTTKANFNAKTAIISGRQAGARVVFLAAVKTAIALIKPWLVAQESSGMLLLGGNELYTPDILIQGADSIDGLVLAVPWSFQATESFAKDALKSWRGRVSWRTATAYDTMKVLGEAIAKSSDRATVVETLNRGITLQGSTTDFNIFNQVPLVRANGGNEGQRVLNISSILSKIDNVMSRSRIKSNFMKNILPILALLMSVSGIAVSLGREEVRCHLG
jgi:ABC-type branched-subunit amino acid transport system substrate-binding protein